MATSLSYVREANKETFMLSENLHNVYSEIWHFGPLLSVVSEAISRELLFQFSQRKGQQRRKEKLAKKFIIN